MAPLINLLSLSVTKSEHVSHCVSIFHYYVPGQKAYIVMRRFSVHLERISKENMSFDLFSFGGVMCFGITETQSQGHWVPLENIG